MKLNSGGMTHTNRAGIISKTHVTTKNKWWNKAVVSVLQCRVLYGVHHGTKTFQVFFLFLMNDPSNGIFV